MKNAQETETISVFLGTGRKSKAFVCYLKCRSLFLSVVGRHFYSVRSWKYSDVTASVFQEHYLFPDTPIKTETEARKYSKPLRVIRFEVALCALHFARPQKAQHFQPHSFLLNGKQLLDLRKPGRRGAAAH